MKKLRFTLFFAGLLMTLSLGAAPCDFTLLKGFLEARENGHTPGLFHERKIAYAKTLADYRSGAWLGGRLQKRLKFRNAYQELLVFLESGILTAENGFERLSPASKTAYLKFLLFGPPMEPKELARLTANPELFKKFKILRLGFDYLGFSKDLVLDFCRYVLKIPEVLINSHLKTFELRTTIRPFEGEWNLAKDGFLEFLREIPRNIAIGVRSVALAPVPPSIRGKANLAFEKNKMALEAFEKIWRTRGQVQLTDAEIFELRRAGLYEAALKKATFISMHPEFVFTTHVADTAKIAGLWGGIFALVNFASELNQAENLNLHAFIEDFKDPNEIRIISDLTPFSVAKIVTKDRVYSFEEGYQNAKDLSSAVLPEKFFSISVKLDPPQAEALIHFLESRSSHLLTYVPLIQNQDTAFAEVLEKMGVIVPWLIDTSSNQIMAYLVSLGTTGLVAGMEKKSWVTTFEGTKESVGLADKAIATATLLWESALFFEIVAATKITGRLASEILADVGPLGILDPKTQSALQEKARVYVADNLGKKGNMGLVERAEFFIERQSSFESTENSLKLALRYKEDLQNLSLELRVEANELLSDPRIPFEKKYIAEAMLEFSEKRISPLLMELFKISR